MGPAGLLGETGCALNQSLVARSSSLVVFLINLLLLLLVRFFRASRFLIGPIGLISLIGLIVFSSAVFAQEPRDVDQNSDAWTSSTEQKTNQSPPSQNESEVYYLSGPQSSDSTQRPPVWGYVSDKPSIEDWGTPEVEAPSTPGHDAEGEVIYSVPATETDNTVVIAPLEKKWFSFELKGAFFIPTNNVVKDFFGNCCNC